VNGGNGFIDVTGTVTMKMLNNIFFLLSLLYDSGNSLLYNNKTGECIGFRVHRDCYEELVIGLLPRKIAERQKSLLGEVLQMPIGDGYCFSGVSVRGKKRPRREQATRPAGAETEREV